MHVHMPSPDKPLSQLFFLHLNTWKSSDGKAHSFTVKNHSTVPQWKDSTGASCWVIMDNSITEYGPRCMYRVVLVDVLGNFKPLRCLYVFKLMKHLTAFTKHHLCFSLKQPSQMVAAWTYYRVGPRVTGGLAHADIH